MAVSLEQTARPVRRTTLIQQHTLGQPVSLQYGLQIRGNHQVELPNPSPLSPPHRLSHDMRDFDGHYRYFSDCLSRLGDSVPIVLTEKHFFSLPLYKALAEKHPDKDIRIICLDMHLDGVNLSYTNWGFWGFGIAKGIINPENLTIIGSSQTEEALAFEKDHLCPNAYTRFRFKLHDQYAKMLDEATAKVLRSNRHLTSKDIRRDPRLRDYAEYACLKNAGVNMRLFSLDENLTGVPIFASFDTDIPLERDQLMEIARKLKMADVLGIHVSEFDLGIALHQQEGIEEFIDEVLS